MPDVSRTVGRYELLRELGRGATGRVYLARQPDLDRLVAVKELDVLGAADPAAGRRFVRAVGPLSHPNVVTVLEAFEQDGTPFVAMELLERGSLRPYVRGLSPAQVAGVLEGMLAGLAHAEEHGVVHGELVPESLMVTDDGRVKIADLGIPRPSGATPAPGSDLRAAGAIAAELLAGTEATPVDPRLRAWVARMRGTDGGAGFESANEAWDELEEIVVGLMGPRWRRSARLGEPPPPAEEDVAPSPRRFVPERPLPAASSERAAGTPARRDPASATPRPPQKPELPATDDPTPGGGAALGGVPATAAENGPTIAPDPRRPAPAANDPAPRADEAAHPATPAPAPPPPPAARPAARAAPGPPVPPDVPAPEPQPPPAAPAAPGAAARPDVPAPPPAPRPAARAAAGAPVAPFVPGLTDEVTWGGLVGPLADDDSGGGAAQTGDRASGDAVTMRQEAAPAAVPPDEPVMPVDAGRAGPRPRAVPPGEIAPGADSGSETSRPPAGAPTGIAPLAAGDDSESDRSRPPDAGSSGDAPATAVAAAPPQSQAMPAEAPPDGAVREPAPVRPAAIPPGEPATWPREGVDSVEPLAGDGAGTVDAVDAPPAARRPRRWRFALLLGAAVALAAIAGAALGSGGEATPPEPTRAAAGDLSARLPPSYRRLPATLSVPGLDLDRPAAYAPPGGRVEVELGTAQSDDPTLMPSGLRRALGLRPGEVPARTAVRLGDGGLQAFRYADLRPAGARRAVTLYAAPTSAGIATVACASAPADAAARQAVCDRAAGSLRLGGSARAVPVGPDPSYARRAGRALTRLRATAAARRRELRAPRVTARSQAAAAAATARAHRAAAAALRGAAATPADRALNARLRASLRGVAAAWDRAAAAARRRAARRFARAGRSISAAERRLSRDIRRLSAAGYTVRR